MQTGGHVITHHLTELQHQPALGLGDDEEAVPADTITTSATISPKIDLLLISELLLNADHAAAVEPVCGCWRPPQWRCRPIGCWRMTIRCCRPVASACRSAGTADCCCPRPTP